MTILFKILMLLYDFEFLFQKKKILHGANVRLSGWVVGNDVLIEGISVSTSFFKKRAAKTNKTIIPKTKITRNTLIYHDSVSRT